MQDIRPTVLKALILPMLAAGPGAIAAHGKPQDLVIAHKRHSDAVILVSGDAGPWEKRAATDLRKYIRLITGAEPQLLVDTILPPRQSAIVIGKAAITADPPIAALLVNTAKKDPVVQADAIAIQRVGNRLYVAGSNDESQYFATSKLLQSWGCHWYVPTDFGEVVPHRDRLTIGDIDLAYAPPFEIRHYWLSWNANSTDAGLFRHRNFMSDARVPGAGQALDQYTADVAPAGGTAFNVPFAEPATADHIVEKIAPLYKAGKDVSLAIADGLYTNDDPKDRVLVTDYDRYMLRPSLTDAMMTLYDNVASKLAKLYPDSKAKIGGLAYVNVTLPPRIVKHAAPNLTMWIAPIDIDPNHAMDDPRSPQRMAYRQMVERWAAVMQGRLAIYDYDQGMLIWRDLPDPSQDVFARDAKLYTKIGILGIGTESRGATATTFLNLFFRGQLMWDPNADPTAMLKAFYPGFYGPAGQAMAEYWEAIFAAWRETDVTEHEIYAAPAVYTPALVARLAPSLARAEAALAAAKGLSAGEAARFAERLRFTRLSFGVIRTWVAAETASATEADYGAAARAGEEELARRLDLARMNPTFTTHVVGPGTETVKDGVAWLPGEVDWFREVASLTDGTRGRMVARTPLLWSLRLGAPMPNTWRYAGEVGGTGPCTAADVWGEGAATMVRTDRYLQTQGIRGPAGADALGDYCYRTTITLGTADAGGKLHLLFPGLFNEAWLSIDGIPVAHRSFREPWWTGNYHFDWDVDLTGRVTPGPHILTLGGFNPLHYAGLFRRPFFYQSVE